MESVEIIFDGSNTSPVGSSAESAPPPVIGFDIVSLANAHVFDPICKVFTPVSRSSAKTIPFRSFRSCGNGLIAEPLIPITGVGKLSPVRMTSCRETEYGTGAEMPLTGVDPAKLVESLADCDH
jgi:hypothetical protein